MKYVWIAILVVLMVRIDYILELMQSMTSRLTPSEKTDAKVTEVVSDSEIISLKNDQAIKVTPRLSFLTMLEDFRADPSSTLRIQALDLLRTQPSMFSERLDRDLEAAVYRWRDLLVVSNPEVHIFLQELLSSLKGENAEMVRRFYSLAMDVNMEDFLKAYARSKDSTCQIAALIADPISEDERYNELAERQLAIAAVLREDKLEPVVKLIGIRCEEALKLALEKMRLTQPTSEEPLQNSNPETASPVTQGSTP